MQTLSQQDCHTLLQRLPEFELSYETIPHKKVSNAYNICLAIPLAKKYLIWFSYRGAKNCIYKMELNRDKKITRVHIMEWLKESHLELCLGTVFYCSHIEPDVYIIEDMFYIRGLTMKGLYWGEKMEHLLWFFENWCCKDFTSSMNPNGRFNQFRMPFVWVPKQQGSTEQTLLYEIPSDLNCGYKIHHIQYRCMSDLLPYVNIQPPKTIKMKESVMVVTQHRPLSESNVAPADKPVPQKKPLFDYLEQEPISNSLGHLDWKKPQYKMPTVFQVCADIQSDVYHMFTYGPMHKPVYYGIAYIPSYECSVFMNSLFRNIKENVRLDAIEESDDEEEFENVAPDKYVDLEKKLLIECVFSMKFKRWIPKRVVLPGSKVVHIHMLQSNPEQVLTHSNPHTYKKVYSFIAKRNEDQPYQGRDSGKGLNGVKKPHTNIYAGGPSRRKQTDFDG